MIHPRLLVSVTAAIALLFGTPSIAQSDLDSSDAAHRIAEYLDAINELGPFNGVILVAKKGKIVAANSYGMADFEFQIPNSPKTKFRIASVTKPITATAVMLLADDEKLSVDDPINKHLRNCPDAWKDITIHHLLTHTSGLLDISDLPGFDERRRAYVGVEDFLKQLGSAPTQFLPGKEHKYNNTNYILLGYIIEAVSGTSYEDFLRQRIFEPLKMANSGCDYGTTIIRNRAAGYSWNKTIVPADYVDRQNVYASGCLYSTAEDLLRFVEALTRGKLLKKRTLDRTLKAYQSDYGYGWHIAKWKDRRVMLHSGGMNGARADVRYLPDDHVCVVVLSNLDVTKASQVAEVLTRFALNEKYVASFLDSPINTTEKVNEVPGDARVAEECVGTYLLPMGELVITREEDKLFVKTPSDPEKAELLRESDTTFFIRGPAGVQMTFIKNRDGQVAEVKLTVRGREFLGKRKQ
jgi:CubicO group peptidase (beta-lactamase class C family)